MSPIRAVVFDLDGTLIDSVPDIAAALNRCLTDEGRPALDEAGVAKLVGGGARELVTRALGGGTAPSHVDRVLEAFLAFYEAAPVQRTRIYPGGRELLASLREAGMPLAICTNKPMPLTRLILDRMDLAPFFAVVWGGEADKPLKPDPRCLITVCERLGTAPGETLMVGDSHADIAAARASGCRSIVVGHGYEQRSLGSLGADAVVAGLADVGLEIARWSQACDFGLRRPARQLS